MQNIKSVDFLKYYRYFRDRLNRPEYFFLIVGGFFALLLCFLNPPLQSVDEPTHFYRIAQLSRGHLVAKHVATQGDVKRYGDTFPAAFIKENDALVHGVDKLTGKYDTGLIGSYLFHNHKSQDIQIEGFEGSAVYTPIVYTAQTIAYKGSGVFTKSTLLRMYAARVANALAWLALIFIAIRLIPFGKWTLVVFALLPMNVFIASSLSADATAIALCFLLVAYVLHLRAQKRRLVPKQIVILGAIMCVVALAKSTYYPVLFSLFLIPKKHFARPRLAWPALLAVPLILSMTWGLIVSPIANSLYRSFFVDVASSPSDQLYYTLHHPFAVMYAFVNSIFSGTSDLTVRDLFGTFTWSRVVLPLWLQLFSFLLLMFALLYQLGRTSGMKFSAWARSVPAIAFAATFGLIYLTFYFLWSAPGATTINGVQGRYFLPLLPLLIPLFTTKKPFINLKSEVFARVVKSGTVLILVVTVIMIATRFY